MYKQNIRYIRIESNHAEAGREAGEQAVREGIRENKESGIVGREDMGECAGDRGRGSVESKGGKGSREVKASGEWGRDGEEGRQTMGGEGEGDGCSVGVMKTQEVGLRKAENVP